jgi:putative membrane protein
MQNAKIKNPAQINSTQSAGKNVNRGRRIGYGIAAALLALCGFFVAVMPVRPELAGVSVIFVVLFAIPSYLSVIRWLGVKQGVLLLLSLGAFALAIESFAVLTGWPYGQFFYGDKIGAKVFGVVPWTVPFAWSPLLLAAMAIASRWGNSARAKIFIAALFLVAIDLVLDPAATSQGFWIWKTPGFYYGVPTINFFGWLLSGVIGAWIFSKLASMNQKTPTAFLSSAFLILCFWSSACFWMKLYFPAVLGVLLLVIIGKYFFSEQ